MLLNELLYHYCSTPTAFAILQTKIIRLSPLSSANDSFEGRIPGRLLAASFRDKGLPSGVVDVASVLTLTYPDWTEGFAFCLSEDGDLLSQWRAYADDGSGISIGFDRRILAEDFGKLASGGHAFELVQVSYDQTALAEEMSKLAEHICSLFRAEGEFVALRNGIDVQNAMKAVADKEADVTGLFLAKRPGAEQLLQRLSKELQPANDRMYSFKPRTFHEEREWRLIRYQRREPDTHVHYATDAAVIRPFLPWKVSDDHRHAIREVIIGPRHRSDPNWVRAFLESVGLGHVKVSRSTAESYR